MSKMELGVSNILLLTFWVSQFIYISGLSSTWHLVNVQSMTAIIIIIIFVWIEEFISDNICQIRKFRNGFLYLFSNINSIWYVIQP